MAEQFNLGPFTHGEPDKSKWSVCVCVCVGGGWGSSYDDLYSTSL